MEKIEEFNGEAEKAGDDGDVEKAMEFMDKAKALKAGLDQIIEDEQKKIRMNGAERKLIICEICANFMSSKDNDERMQDHCAALPPPPPRVTRCVRLLRARFPCAGPSARRDARTVGSAPPLPAAIWQFMGRANRSSEDFGVFQPQKTGLKTRKPVALSHATNSLVFVPVFAPGKLGSPNLSG